MSPEPDIVLVLPLPPSANRIWRMSNGVQHKSGEYKTWLRDAGIMVARQAGGDRCPYLFEVRITLPPTRRDPDNSLKPTLDLLQACGVVANDRYARLISIAVDVRRDPDSMLVEVWALPDPLPVKGRRTKPALKAAQVEPVNRAR